jgi:hypothetical protein
MGFSWLAEKSVHTLSYPAGPLNLIGHEGKDPTGRKLLNEP